MSFWLTFYLISISIILFLLVCFVAFRVIKNLEEEAKNRNYDKRLKEVKKKTLNENIREFFTSFPEDD